MSFQKYVPWNNAQGTLLAGISAGAGTMILGSGQGDRFPSTFPFLCEAKQNDAVAPYAVLKREIVKVTGRTGDTLTIVRSAGTCLPNDASNTPGTTAFAFSAGDTITLTITAETIKDIQDEVENLWSTKLASAGGLRTGFGAGKHVRVNSSTGNEESKGVTTGATIDSTDIILIEKPSGDFERTQVSILQSVLTGLISEYIYAGPTASVNDSCYFSNLLKYRGATALSDIGKTTATTSFPMYAKGTTEQNYTFYFTKTGTPQDLTFRIETDNGSWSPSGTLVNANAVLVTAIASIPTAGIYTITLPASVVNATAGTKIHFVFWQWSQAISGVNYISIGMNVEAPVVFDNVASPGSNVTASRALVSTTGTTTTYSVTFDCIADCQLVSIDTWGTGSLTVTNVTDWNVVEYNDASVPLWNLLGVFKFRNGKKYTLSGTIPGTIPNVTSYNTVVNSAHLQWVNGTAAGWQLRNVVTRTATINENAGVLFKYISKANATNSIKSAVYAILWSGAATGTYPSVLKDRYAGGYTNLVKWLTYYLSDTGVISPTAGTVSKVLWVAINSTTIRIDSAINAS